MVSRINVALTADLHRALRQLADEQHTSIAHLLEEACIEHFKLDIEKRTREIYIKDRNLGDEVSRIKAEALRIEARAKRANMRPPRYKPGTLDNEEVLLRLLPTVSEETRAEWIRRGYLPSLDRRGI